MNAAGITINTANSKCIDNYRYEFTVPEGYALKDQEVALTNAVITNSVYNLSKAGFNNVDLSYTYPSGVGMATFAMTIPDGSYNIDVLSEYIQAQMVANKTYLVDNGGNSVFHIKLNVSSVYWGIALTCDPVPVVLPAGWSLPSGAPALPSVPTTPQLVVSPTNNFGQLIGYNAGSYPPVVQQTQYIAIGQVEAQVTPQWAFSVSLSLVNLPTVNPSSPGSVFPFTYTVPYQGQQVLDPYNWRWFPCVDGRYTKIILTILDQEGRPAILASKFAQFSLAFRGRL